MADCECLPGCIFFNDKMSEIPTTVEMLKKRYCTGDNSQCARYMVKVIFGAAKVPADLFPSQIEKAQAFIKANS